MRRLIIAAVLVVLALGALTLFAPTPTSAAAPCLKCPLAPLPEDCPPCYQFVPQTCRQCAHCERIKGCHT